MRPIEYARAKGRDARNTLGASPSPNDFLRRLEDHLRVVHGLSLVPMATAQMNGSRAEIDAETMVLKYDASLGPDQRLMLYAHELGHLMLHRRVSDPNARRDPLLASAYGDAGPHATARYSPRTNEEAQATAFALELVAPSEAAWSEWLGDARATASSVAAQFGCGRDIIQTQLAHALHHAALGGPLPSASRKDVPFTPAQLTAARFTGAPAIVDAGPGTGKTATVIRRIQFLLGEQGAHPSNILALTFSNEAAQELAERIATAFGADVADQLNVRTFHGFGVEFLHLHGHLLGLSETFELLDEDRQIELVSDLLGHVPCDDIIDLRVPNETATRLVEHINFCKQRLIGVDDLHRCHPEERSDEGSAFHSELAAPQFVDIYRAYESRKRAADRIDFADLIALPIHVLEQHAHVRDAYVARFPWVIVDEFQDVTRATSRLLRALCGPTNPPWVVGDARQSIYQFLGAAPENVSAFTNDFAHARRFALDVNFRSSGPVVTAANQLAALMETTARHPERSDGFKTDRHPERSEGSACQPGKQILRCAQDDSFDRWKPGNPTTPLGTTPVSIAEAATDGAEANGVAARVRDWIVESGVSPGDIAVLCRRHVDVRNIILELTRRGIKAQASGLLTAEGAAGDLATMLTLADAPAASIPRVGFALGRARRSADHLHATIGGLLREWRRDRGTGEAGPLDDDVAIELMQLYDTLEGERDQADGFTALATILFDHGDYLRRILAMPDSAERSMALVEVVSVLSLATAYRATHHDVLPRAARVGFAERLRVRLTKTLPVPLSPRPRTDAVHVMTCHASKGLEFPCVAVVGQTLPAIDDQFVWLPPSLRPEQSREQAQADALLFVGVTRAKRSVLVSFPRRAAAGTRGRGKSVVPLLQRWREAFGVPTVEWTDEAVPDVGARLGNIWGVPLQTHVKASALDDSVCPILTYLESYVHARFPSASRELYPSFFSGVRQALRRVVGFAAEAGCPASEDDARGILGSSWYSNVPVDHPHLGLYRTAAERMVASFAAAFRGMALGGVNELESEAVLPSNDGLDVRLDLIASYRRSDGTAVAIGFRPESLRHDGDGPLNWSELAESKRSAFALLESARPGVLPYVYSGADGRIYEYRWSKNKKSLPTLARGLEDRRAAMARGDFSADVTRYQCDRCRVRASCPQWALDG